MAKQMIFEAADGTIHPDSYWRPVQINLSPEDKTGLVIFYGFKDVIAADRLNTKSPIGNKRYALDKETYDLYFSDQALTLKNPLKQAYDLATATRDTDDASFFANAVDV